MREGGVSVLVASGGRHTVAEKMARCPYGKALGMVGPGMKWCWGQGECSLGLARWRAKVRIDSPPDLGNSMSTKPEWKVLRTRWH